MRKLMPLVMVVTLLFVVTSYTPMSSAGVIQHGDGVASTPTPTPDPDLPAFGTEQATSSTSESEADYLTLLILNGLLSLF